MGLIENAKTRINENANHTGKIYDAELYLLVIAPEFKDAEFPNRTEIKEFQSVMDKAIYQYRFEDKEYQATPDQVAYVSRVKGTQNNEEILRKNFENPDVVNHLVIERGIKVSQQTKDYLFMHGQEDTLKLIFKKEFSDRLDAKLTAKSNRESGLKI